MIKKLSIIFICILLIGATNISFMGFCCPVYTFADEVNALTSDNVEELSIMAYMNSRGGYITSGSTTAAIGVAKQYVSSFYASEANTTTIKSSSDLLSHVSITKENDYGISIDSEGITFLNHLVRWLLGQNKFPNLYSGGSWGNDLDSSDKIYEGMEYSGTLFYFMKNAGSNASSTGVQSTTIDKIQRGSPVDGWTPESLLSYFCTNTNHTVNEIWKNEALSGQDNCVVPIKYFSDLTRNVTLMRSRSTVSIAQPYTIFLYFNDVGGNITGSEQNLVAGAIINNGRISTRSVPAYICLQNNNVNYYYVGYVGINEEGYVSIRKAQSINRNNYSGINDAIVNFDTDNFVKEDTNDTEGIKYIPSYSNDGGNTYNTYNTNSYTEQTFIDTYIDDYINKRTVINNEQIEPDPEPEEPGGVIPDWSGNGGSGTITPDGNGGYTFNLPDFELPDLDIDWKISGLTEKFPFSIPFDLIAFFTVLNAEPVTPELQAEIPLGRYSWEIDWSMDQFEPLAIILRNLEFIGFCIGLALITRHIIKG